MRRLGWIAGSILLVSVSCSSPVESEEGLTAFTGMSLFDGRQREAVQNAVLIVRDGHIESVGAASEVTIPPTASRVDLQGRMVVPGLIVSHGHVGSARGLESGPEVSTEENIRQQLKLYADYGVTTVLSLGLDSAASRRVRDSQDTTPAAARLLIAGTTIDTEDPAAALQLVADNADQGVDWIKVRVDDNLGTKPKMPPSVYRAVIEAAHARGLPVAAHLFYREDARELLAAGVDLVAHSVRDQPVDEALIEQWKASGVCLCPTLVREVSTYVYGDVPEFFEDPFFLTHADPDILQQLQDPTRMESVRQSRSAQLYQKALQVAVDNLRTLANAGVPIAFGTDSGPPARFQGYFEHLELELMAKKAGLSPLDVLLSATGNAANCLELSDVGILEAGRLADFLVVDGDPLRDIREMRKLESVWIGGQRLD